MFVCVCVGFFLSKCGYSYRYTWVDGGSNPNICSSATGWEDHINIPEEKLFITSFEILKCKSEIPIIRYRGIVQVTDSEGKKLFLFDILPDCLWLTMKIKIFCESFHF